MANPGGKAIIGEDLVVLGDVRNGGEVEVRGAILGSVVADQVIVHPGGRVVGVLEAGSADVNGFLEGRIRVRNLISIGSSGVVHGDVRYGQLSLAAGGDLAAEVRNIPPHLTGDFEVVVRRGRTVRLTPEDLAAVDPDDSAEQLNYFVSNVTDGYLAREVATDVSIETFTQAEVDSGAIIFAHDGGAAEEAGFDVVVMDSAGNSSGAARRVTVKVIASL